MVRCVCGEVYEWIGVANATHCSGIVSDLEVSNLLPGLELGLAVVGGLAVVVQMQLLNKALVGGFGEQTLFIQQGENAHGLQREEREMLKSHTRVLVTQHIQFAYNIMYIFVNTRVHRNKDREFISTKVNSVKMSVCMCVYMSVCVCVHVCVCA